MAYPGSRVDRLTFKLVMVEELDSVEVLVDVLEKEEDDGHVQKLCLGSGSYGQIFIDHLPANR